MHDNQEIGSQPAEGSKVAIIACAGTDKALGSVTRTCAFRVVEKLRPKDTVLVCIPPLVADVKPYSELVKKNPVIRIDGCAERCATKIAVKSGAKIKWRVFMPQSAQKYSLKPDAASDVGVEGEELAEKTAEEIAFQIDKILGR